jgi:hypothetical protein
MPNQAVAPNLFTVSQGILIDAIGFLKSPGVRGWSNLCKLKLEFGGNGAKSIDIPKLLMVNRNPFKHEKRLLRSMNAGFLEGFSH